MEPLTLAPADTARRYQLVDEGRTVGFVEYHRFAALAIVTHTEVLGVAKGQGYGSRLVRAALAHLREQGCRVVPVCGFFASYIRKHPEHAEQLTPVARQVFQI